VKLFCVRRLTWRTTMKHKGKLILASVSMRGTPERVKSLEYVCPVEGTDPVRSMKALVFDGKITLQEIPTPDLAMGEALIKVLMAGICKTDAEITAGYMDFRGVPGHEFVGFVETSPDPELQAARVVGEINAGCGTCSLCRKGMERHCPHRTVLGILGRNGAMAEYITLPVRNLLVVPDGLSNVQAVFTEPLAAALEILEQVHVQPDHHVLVIGDGKLGLLVSMVLRLTGCNLLLVGKHPEKMEILARTGGTAILLEDLQSREDRFDVVVEASGNPSGWELALTRVKPRGTIVLKSTYHQALDFNPSPLVIDEVTVVGSRCGRFGPALRIMEQGLLDPTPLVSAVYPFDKAEEAFERSMEKGVLKVLLQMVEQ
jgi:threonine dehydrogenase-like Zn-dependent dehydrogenase